MMDSIRIALDGPRLEGLEMILSGLIPAADGYGLPSMNPGDRQVMPHLRLAEFEAARIRIGAKIELCDTDGTSLAILDVEDLAEAPEGGIWVAGRTRPMRSPEHGSGRGFRLTVDVDLSRTSVVLFSPDIRPVDMVRAILEAGEGPLELIAEGSPDRSASARLVQRLQEAAHLLPCANVRYVPSIDYGKPSVDVTTVVLTHLGAGDILDLRRPYPGSAKGAVVLFTGLSGSGKSTVARGLASYVDGNSSHKAVLLDGDHIRRELASELGFSAEDRDRNLRRQAWVAARVAEGGGLAICAPIAPFAVSRAAMRAAVEPVSPFLMVYVSTPLEVAESRDRKGLYAKARAGALPDFTGIDSPYEVPEDADLVIDTSVLSVEESVAKVVVLLTEQGLLEGVRRTEPRDGVPTGF